MSQASYEDHGVILSFVLRFYSRPSEEKEYPLSWRIKVKHIQENNEVSFTTLDQAVTYVKQCLKE